MMKNNKKNTKIAIRVSEADKAKYANEAKKLV